MGLKTGAAPFVGVDDVQVFALSGRCGGRFQGTLMSFSIAGKTAVVTGAANGVGRAIGSASIAASIYVSLFVRGIGRACEASALQHQRVCLVGGWCRPCRGDEWCALISVPPSLVMTLWYRSISFVVLRSTSFVCCQTFDVLCL